MKLAYASISSRILRDHVVYVFLLAVFIVAAVLSPQFFKMEVFIQSNPQIDGIIADGGQMAYGAVEALLDAGKKIPPITADDWNGWLRMAKEHDIDFLAESGGNPLALTCVDLAVKILRGEPVPKIVEYPVVTFGKDELDKPFNQSTT